MIYRHCSSTLFGQAIRRIQVNRNDMELNGAHRLLFHADDVNILGGSFHTIEKNTKAWLVGSMEIEMNGDKTNYTVMSRDQNAGRSHNIKIDISSYEWAE